MEAGEFRRDLFARLAGFVIELPTLRQRREDIGLLIATLLKRIAGDEAGSIRFARKAARRLFMYDWPMNVRELEQVLHAATLMAEGGKIEVAHLPEAIARPARSETPKAPEAHLTPVSQPSSNPDATPTPTPAKPKPKGIRATDRDAPERLRELARTCAGNIAAMARALGTSRSQVRRLLKRHGIDPRAP